MHYLDIPPVLGSQFFDSGLQLRPELTSCGYWASCLTSLFPRLCGEMIGGAVSQGLVRMQYSKAPGKMTTLVSAQLKAVLLLLSQSLVLRRPTQASLRAGSPIALDICTYGWVALGSLCGEALPLALLSSVQVKGADWSARIPVLHCAGSKESFANRTCALLAPAVCY